MTIRSQNRHFNRWETTAGHEYINRFGYLPIGETIHTGFIKCKLAHGLHYSVVVPDLLFPGEGAQWIQPLAFGPNLISKFVDQIDCRFNVDVSCGTRLIVSFTNRDLVTHLADGSDLYRCSFQGPVNLENFVTGTSILQIGAAPLISLYHHTMQEAKESIRASHNFWSSVWNIQGTKRKLTNVGYVYFTSLDKIEFDADLNAIAMASNGYVEMWVDGFIPPENMLKKDMFKRYSSYLLRLPVYRASTKNRTAALELRIDCSCLAPQHIWRHESPEGVWYEICNPFTHRVGVLPGQELPFVGEEVWRGTFAEKQFEYVIVGDATQVTGLAAPYDEENTTDIWKIERIAETSTIPDFWMENGNQDLYSGKTPEMQRFADG